MGFGRRVDSLSDLIDSFLRAPWFIKLLPFGVFLIVQLVGYVGTLGEPELARCDDALQAIRDRYEVACTTPIPEP